MMDNQSYLAAIMLGWVGPGQQQQRQQQQAGAEHDQLASPPRDAGDHCALLRTAGIHTALAELLAARRSGEAPGVRATLKRVRSLIAGVPATPGTG
jgi:hypothetical protein